MGMNKDLPREEQLKIVLKNYDKKSAECDALKVENAELKKQLEQKDILYKNMVNRYEKNVSTTATAIQWEKKYNTLKNQYNECVKANKKLKSIFKQVSGLVADASHRVALFKSSMSDDSLYIEKDEKAVAFVPSLENIPAVENSPVNVPLTRADFQENQFIKYVRTIWKNFNGTGSLRGISNVAREIGVTALTKEQFFQFGLNTEHLTNDYILNVYKQIKKR